MARGRKPAEDADIMEAHEEETPGFEFNPIPGMIRLLRRPFDLGAVKYHFKSIIGVADHQGRAIKKMVACTPVPSGAGWEEWLVQDNPGNRATIETAFRDPAFCYTPIYPEDKDAISKYARAVKAYIGMLEKSCTGMDEKFQAIHSKTAKIQEEIASLMDSGLTESDATRLDVLSRQEEGLRSELFEAEKAFRICKARIKSQQDLLERLG